MKFKHIITAIMVAWLCVMPSNAYAWWPIMHYCIARDQLVDEGITVPAYANIPDVWPRNIAGNIYDVFYFSHAVVDTGGDFLGLTAPAKPEYLHDGRYPELAMAEFTKKVSRTVTDQEKQMILGYAAHSAMDSNVHFNFFSGGTVHYWREGHLRKEEWADYYAYTRFICGVVPVDDMDGNGVHYGFVPSASDVSSVFTTNGNPARTIEDKDISIPTDGAWLLALAQKSLRKTGYNILANGGNKFTVSESEDAITERINEANNTNFGSGLRGITDPGNTGDHTPDSLGGDYGSIRSARFEQLRELAWTEHWTLAQLVAATSESIRRAKAWVPFVKGAMQ